MAVVIKPSLAAPQEEVFVGLVRAAGSRAEIGICVDASLQAVEVSATPCMFFESPD